MLSASTPHRCDVMFTCDGSFASDTYLLVRIGGSHLGQQSHDGLDQMKKPHSLTNTNGGEGVFL